MTTGLESGEIVGGYRIERLLGRGGMAAVYLAEDTRLKRKVALKVLSPELAADEVFRQRFVDESERLASVDHPNIIPVYEAGQADGHLFIAMRLVDTTDLKKLIATEGPLPPGRAVALVTQIAGALDAAHAKGLVHRDVKPANVLVALGSGGDHAYLSDFGLTKRTEETSGLTKTGYFMGTIDYVAPEQISGKGVDGRTDQYALACVLFQCLTGHPPYQRDDDAAVLFSHLSEPVPSVTEARPDLPAAIDGVLAKGMAKEKEDRYADCMALARAAREALLGDGAPSGGTKLDETRLAQPVREGPDERQTIPAPPEPGRPQRRQRSRTSIWIGAAVLIVAIVAGGVALLSGGDPGGGGRGSESGSGGGSGTEGAITLVALDANDGGTVSTLADGVSSDLPGTLSIEDDQLWQATADTLVRRDADTGEILQSLEIKRAWKTIDGGLGFAWISHSFSPGVSEVERLDPESGASLEEKFRDGDPVDLRVSRNSAWLLTDDGTLTELDREMNQVRTFDTGIENAASAIPVGGFVWICECDEGRVARFDPAEGSVVEEIPLPPDGFLIGVDTNFSEGEQAWIVDPGPNTIAPIDARSGEVGAAIEVPGGPITDAALVGSVLWVSSQKRVTKVDTSAPNPDTRSFRVPQGISAGSIAPTDGAVVWVGNIGE
jgi:serine/threonine protein kinase